MRIIKKKKQIPQASSLLQGSFLGTIAHSISVMLYPDFSHEQSWDGINYNIQDSMGSRGTVTFAGDQVVGVFFDCNSPRNPYRSGENNQILLQRLFNGIPAYLWNIAKKEALQYVLQEYNGQVLPVVTAVFWSKGEYLTAAEPWDRVFGHGAHLVKLQLLDIESAIVGWQEEYEFLPAQVDLMRQLFNRKMAAPGHSILLSEQELSILRSRGTEGLEASRELLAAIGLVLPD